MDPEAKRISGWVAAAETARATPLEELIAAHAWIENAFSDGISLRQAEEYASIKRRLQPQIESARLLRREGSSIASEYVTMLLRIQDALEKKETALQRHGALLCERMGRHLEDGLAEASAFLEEQRPLLTTVEQRETLHDLEAALTAAGERTRRSLKEKSVRALDLVRVDDARKEYAMRMEAQLASYEQKTAKLQDNYAGLVNGAAGRCSQTDAKDLFDKVRLHAEEGRHLADELGKRELKGLEERTKAFVDEAIRLEHQAGLLYDTAHTNWKNRMLGYAAKGLTIVVIGLATLKTSFYIPQIMDAWTHRRPAQVSSAEQEPRRPATRSPMRSLETQVHAAELQSHQGQETTVDGAGRALSITREPLEAQVLVKSYAAQRRETLLSAPMQRFAVYITRRGDSLSRIRQELYHDNDWRKLYDANKGMVDDQRRWIYPGQPLILPEEGLVNHGEVTYVLLSAEQTAATQREGRLATPLYRAPGSMSYADVSRDLTGTTSYAESIRDASGGVNRALGERIHANDYVSLPPGLPIRNASHLFGAGR